MKTFLISSLLAAGFYDSSMDDLILKEKITTDNPLLNNLKRDGLMFAAHSSHASHGSHGSHRSSSTPKYTPSPKYEPKGDSTTPKTLVPKKNYITPGSNEWIELTKQVQYILFYLGYYNGPIDGLNGSKTRLAISKYQRDNNLRITGDLTNQLIKKLGVPGY